VNRTTIVFLAMLCFASVLNAQQVGKKNGVEARLIRGGPTTELVIENHSTSKYRIKGVDVWNFHNVKKTLGGHTLPPNSIRIITLHEIPDHATVRFADFTLAVQ
jgi:hypothetical protein